MSTADAFLHTKYRNFWQCQEKAYLNMPISLVISTKKKVELALYKSDIISYTCGIFNWATANLKDKFTLEHATCSTRI